MKDGRKKKTVTKLVAGSKAQNKEKTKTSFLEVEVMSVIFLMLAVFIFVCLRNHQVFPDDTKFVGLIGSFITDVLEALLGTAALLAAFYFLSWAIHLGTIKKYWSIRMTGVTILTLTVLIAISLYRIPIGFNSWEAGIRGLGGGYIGGALGYALFKLVGNVGAAITLLIGAMLGLVMIINRPISDIVKFFLTKTRNLMYDAAMFVTTPENNQHTPVHDKPEPVIINHAAPPVEDHHLAEPPVLAKPSPTIIGPSEKEGAKKKLEIVYSRKETDFKYQKPPLDLLSEISSERTIDKKNIKESVSVLEETFASFGITVKVNQVSCGPAITRYELTPAPGVKISKIISLSDDLQLNLAAPGIRIEAPIPGKSAIGIEVPNSRISSVGLRHLLSSKAFINSDNPLTFGLGEDIAGNSVVATLSDMPHLLIAGSTGSGKSVCLNSIIMSLLFNATPEQLRLVFIDPKMVELTVYNGIPHLMTPVVTDPKKASVVLRWMVTEMDKRYKAFAEKGVRDIYRYNQGEKEKMPYIVIVIDELADLMMVAPVEVEDSICRLAQMARAAGMHLVVATQRPSVDVVTGVIKANIPSRIAFAVSSQADSRTILDMGGAEKLLGKGDMLFFPVGANKPYRVQGAYVSDNDIEKTVNFIKEQVSGHDIPDMNEDLAMSLQQADADYGDELFWEAVQIFVDAQKASVSMLQRKLRIGYSRAARLVDLMEERGIVSELDNNKKREILIDQMQLEKLYPKDNLG
ncbi:MAG: DNA translocase FtsK [Syntrophomonadaceae bacterium]|jgi:S-DNA-T family DNA segregation ATPase FtsK/SpoIIIE